MCGNLGIGRIHRAGIRDGNRIVHGLAAQRRGVIGHNGNIQYRILAGNVFFCRYWRSGIVGGLIVGIAATIIIHEFDANVACGKAVGSHIKGDCYCRSGRHILRKIVKPVTCISIGNQNTSCVPRNVCRVGNIYCKCRCIQWVIKTQVCRQGDNRIQMRNRIRRGIGLNRDRDRLIDGTIADGSGINRGGGAGERRNAGGSGARRGILPCAFFIRCRRIEVGAAIFTIPGRSNSICPVRC